MLSVLFFFLILYSWQPLSPMFFTLSFIPAIFCMGLIAGLFELMATSPHLFGSLLISLLICF